MSDTKFPTVDFEKALADFNNTVKEAAYVAVGLGVLGFQKAQVQRVELMKQMEAQFALLTSLSGNFNGQFESYLTTAREQIADLRSQFAKLAERPDAAAVREQLADLAKAVDEAVAPARQQFEDQLNRIEEVLPTTARTLVQTVRSAANTQEQVFRSAVGLA